jgi:hypothetical protein
MTVTCFRIDPQAGHGGLHRKDAAELDIRSRPQ